MIPVGFFVGFAFFVKPWWLKIFPEIEKRNPINKGLNDIIPCLDLKIVEVRKSISYRKLAVWRLAIAFVKDSYQALEQIPFGENSGLTQQIRKTANFIPAHIVEGQFTDSFRELGWFLFSPHGVANISN